MLKSDFSFPNIPFSLPKTFFPVSFADGGFTNIINGACTFLLADKRDNQSLMNDLVEFLYISASFHLISASHLHRSILSADETHIAGYKADID